jgi:hypothetical protein
MSVLPPIFPYQPWVVIKYDRSGGVHKIYGPFGDEALAVACVKTLTKEPWTDAEAIQVTPRPEPPPPAEVPAKEEAGPGKLRAALVRRHLAEGERGPHGGPGGPP